MVFFRKHWNGLQRKGFFYPPPPKKKKFLIKTGRCNFCYCKIPPRCPENIPHKPFIISYIQIRKILRKNILENSYNYNKHVNLIQTSENVTTDYKKYSLLVKIIHLD